MQSFNYFLVATAFLASAFASLLERSPAVAAGVAIVGAWIAFWFTRLDRRTRQLLNAGESALEVAQARLADRADMPSVRMLEQVRKPEAGAATYRQIISAVEWTMVLGFAVLAAYAAFHAVSPAAFGR